MNISINQIVAHHFCFTRTMYYQYQQVKSNIVVILSPIKIAKQLSQSIPPAPEVIIIVIMLMLMLMLNCYYHLTLQPRNYTNSCLVSLISCSLWQWNLGKWSFSVDRFSQWTTGGERDKLSLDVLSAGKLPGIASAAMPNSTKKSLLHPLSLIIPARSSRIASLLVHTCYYNIFLRAVDKINLLSLMSPHTPNIMVVINVEL